MVDDGSLGFGIGDDKVSVADLKAAFIRILGGRAGSENGGRLTEEAAGSFKRPDLEDETTEDSLKG